MGIVDTLRLVGIPGTNKVMAGELSRLCSRALSRRRLETPAKAGTGTLIYPFDPEVARVAACYHRTASRALWDICDSRAGRLEPLYDQVREAVAADERGWLWDGARLSIRGRNLGGFAAGPRQVVGAVKNAVIDGAAVRGLRVSLDADAPTLPLSVRRHDDVVTLSVDLVGRPMHARGYRRAAGVAPLRENLAAVLLMLARWNPREEVLVDPMAGSGTIAVEAALMSRAEPLGAGPPALHGLPAFEGAPLAEAPLFGDTAPRIFASDLDRNAVGRARDNARAAGVAADIAWRPQDALSLTPATVADAIGEGTGVIVSNPPYGERLDVDEDFYRELGEACRGFRGWRAAFLVANPDFASAFGGRPRVTKPLSNGSQRAYFYLYDL